MFKKYVGIICVMLGMIASLQAAPYDDEREWFLESCSRVIADMKSEGMSSSEIKRALEHGFDMYKNLRQRGFDPKWAGSIVNDSLYGYIVAHDFKQKGIEL